MNPLAPLSVDPDDFCFFDTETRALPGLGDPRWGNVKLSGAYRYARSCRVIVLTYAIGNGPVKEWVAPLTLDTSLRWIDAPPDLLQFMARALKGEAWFVAWNAAFDREVSNHAIVRPSNNLVMPIRTLIDASPQAMASGLPGGLGHAAKILGLTQKVEEGKKLISLFTTADGWTGEDHPDEWARFLAYARDDVAAMRDIFFATRQLTRRDWEEYWAAETVNARGLPIDRDYVERAAALADVYEAGARAEVQRITGEDWGPKHHVALANWAYDKLEPTQPMLCDILVTSYEEGDQEEDWVVGKVSLDRQRIEKVIAFLEALDEKEGLTDDEFAVLELCRVKLYGAGGTIAKFGKMLPMLSGDDRLRGQYVFNGAAQTGRFSSKGVQMHNLTRQWVGLEDGDPTLEEQALIFIGDLEP